MEPNDEKELLRLQKDKKEAERKNKFPEVAQICNVIGELLCKYGQFQEAITEHEMELSISETYKDTLGSAVACRKLGECYCELGDFSKAIQLQKRYLTLACSVKDTVEEQRAWATIGRTYLFQAESEGQTETGCDASVKAEKAFVKSLELCERIKQSLNTKEYMAMKSRIFLNLGIVYSYKKNYNESKVYMKRSLSIALANNLSEDLFRVHYLLADTLSATKDIPAAQQSIDSAITTAKKIKKKQLLTDAWLLKFQICFKAQNFSTACHCLKMVKKIGASTDEHNLLKFYRAAKKSEEALNQASEDKNESVSGQMKVYEILADNATNCNLYELAIKHYLKVLELANQLKTPQSELVPIFMSLAQTYQDDHQYLKAIHYYQKEIEHYKSNPEQACRTYLNIAINQENVKMSYEVIKLTYLKALQCAQEAKHLVLERLTLRSLVQLQEAHKKESKKYIEKLKLAGGKIKSSNDSDPSDDDDDDEDTHASDCNTNSQNVTDAEEPVDMSDLTDSESEEEEEEEKDEPQNNMALPKRRTTSTRFKIKRNEKGETLLHRACIDGNLKRVKLLLQQGHPVNVRDHCGWLPLHEACNHDFYEIAEVLLHNGAYVNDKGGEQCEGMTPLIDAANCGNIDIMRLLINYQADIFIKDSENNFALSSLLQWRRRAGKLNPELEESYQNMVKLLQERMGIKDISSWAKSKNINQDRVEDVELSAAAPSKRTTKKRKETTNNDLSAFIEDDNSDYSSDSDDNSIRLGQIDKVEVDKYAADVYKNTISNLHSASHRLMCGSSVPQMTMTKTGPQGALVPEEEYINDDWLINDLRPAKRKRTNSSYIAREPWNPRTSVNNSQSGSKRLRTLTVISDNEDNSPDSSLDVDLQNSQSDCDDLNARNNNSENDNPLETLQTEVMSSNPIADFSTDLTPVNTPVQFPQMNRSTNRSIPATTVTKIFVRVGTIQFCVPLSANDQSNNIAWLTQETARRVYAQCQLKPLLLLTTKSGAFLCPDDEIRMLVENGEELEARVTSWDLPSIQQRYVEACNTNKTIERPDLKLLLEQAEASGCANLSRLSLQSSSLQSVFRAFKYQSNLSNLNLSGNKLADTGLQMLAKMLDTIPGLISLDISCNGITAVGLMELKKAIDPADTPSLNPELGLMAFSQKPLQKLELLNLSYNCLTDQSSNVLMGLICGLPSLTRLSLASCNITQEFFEMAYRSPPARGEPHDMRACFLQHVDVSFNNLELGGIRLLFKWLDPTRLVHLDLAWTTKKSSLPNQIVCSSLMNFLPLCEQPKLRELSLAGCDLSSDDGNLIVRLPCFAVKLRSVNLSNNPCLGQQVLYELLDNATSNGHCALEHVDMSHCGITAPLHSDLLDSISSKLSSEMPLVKLRFSCRQLDSVDKNSLQQVWTGHWGDLGVTDFWKNQVCLSVRNSDQR